MSDIFDYTDYRKFLKDTFTQLKQVERNFTYRHIADSLDFKSTGYVTQIIQGKSNVSEQMTQKIAALVGLRKREAHYFEIMVQYNQAKSHEDKRLYFKKMIAYKKGRSKTLNPEEFEFYDRWYYSAIRALLHYYKFDGDYEKLASLLIPRISVPEARKTVAVLEKLGLIIKNDEGFFVLSSKHITTGPNADSVVVNNFVLNTLDIAKDALYRFPREERCFSALTLSVSKDGYALIKNRVDELRRELIEINKNDSNVNRVCQVNFQIFPLSESSGEGVHE